MKRFLNCVKLIGVPTHKCNGYTVIYCPEHPSANKTGYVYLHRVLKEIEIGRFLKSNEHVHHIDENRSNNDLSNLIILSPGEHKRQHVLNDLKKQGIIEEFVDDVCKDCGVKLTNEKILRRDMRRCVKCGHYSERKVKNRPTVDELITMNKTLPRTKIAKIYGVSETAIRKWMGLRK